MAEAAMLVSAATPKLRSLPETEMRSALARHNPGAPRDAIFEMAQLLDAISRTISALSAAERGRIPLAEDRLREILLDAGRHQAADVPVRVAYEADGPVERSEGAGLGERISRDDGIARLTDYAISRPVESWAGLVAGAGEIEARLGIPRSTLNEWHRRGAVIGLLRGERKRDYPLEQFVDARPVAGLADVVRVAPDARAAWLWLRQPHFSLDMQTPLAMLKGGHCDRVVKAAERDFG